MGTGHEGDDGGRAEDEHRADHGRGNDHGTADGAGGVATFSGEDGDVFEAAESTEEHLAEKREHAQVVGRSGECEGRVVNGLVMRIRDQRKEDERGENDEDGDAADIVDPLAEFEAAQRGESDAGEHEENDGQGDDAVFGKPCSGGADEVGDFRRHGVEDGGDDRDAIDPEVPRGEEAAEVAEGLARPDIEAALEWHGAVEADDRCRHGDVEDKHGGDPGDGLRGAESASDADPGSADDAENLREDEIAEAEGPVERLAAGVRRMRSTLGHGSYRVQGTGCRVQGSNAGR